MFREMLDAKDKKKKSKGRKIYRQEKIKNTKDTEE